jgi:hypothetical protein
MRQVLANAGLVPAAAAVAIACQMIDKCIQENNLCGLSIPHAHHTGTSLLVTFGGTVLPP